MQRLRHLVCATAITTAFSLLHLPPVICASAAYDSHTEAATNAFNERDYAQAEKYFQAALDEVESDGDSKELATTLGFVALCRQKQGKFSEAEPMYKRAIAMAEKLELDNVLRGNLNNLASLHMKTGDFVQAQKLFARALPMFEKDPGKDKGDLALCLTNEGIALSKLGKYSSAEKLVERAISIYEKSGAEEHSAVMSYPNNALALVYLAEAQLDAAEVLAYKELEATEAPASSKSVRAANAWRNLGLILMQRENYSEAEKALSKARNIRKETLGAANEETGIAMADLGDSMAASGRADEGVALGEEAVSIVKKAVGSEHALVADALISLADTYKRAGQKADAKRAYKQALAILSESAGSDSPRYAEISKRADNVDTDTTASNTSDSDSSESSDTNDETTTTATADGSSSSSGSDSGSQDSSSSGTTAESGKEAHTPPKPPKTAPSNQATSSSDSSSSSSTAASPDDESKPVADKWALVIGISKFKDSSHDLKFAAKDALSFKDYLLNEGKFATDHVVTLTDQDATRENILAAIGDKWLPRVVGQDDLVIIFISSHGSSSSMDVNEWNYLVAHNTDTKNLYATGIPMQELTDMIKKRIKCNRVVLILDACHSGAAQVAQRGLFRPPTNFNADFIAQGTGQLVICSSSPQQSSWESKQYQNGVFTKCLIDALRQKQTLDDAFDLMKSKVETEVKRDRGEVQTPVLKAAWKGRSVHISAPPARPRAGIKPDIVTSNTGASPTGH